MDRTIVLGSHCKLDLLRDVLIRGTKRIDLPRLHVHVLECLGENLDKPVSIKVLTEALWSSAGSEETAKLYVLIHRIRRKIEDDIDNPKFLISVSRTGYMLRSIDH